MSEKVYQVFIVDEYNNNWNLGFFPNLNIATDAINEFLKGYDVQIKYGDVQEYPSTFGSCFDVYLNDILDEEEERDELYGIMIRGFVFGKEELLKEIEGLDYED